MAKKKSKCKSKKGKTNKTNKPPKLYCPLAMVRYDGGKNGYSTMWVCKICLLCCLSDDAATQHSSKCRASFKLQKKLELAEQAPRADPIGATLYNCNVCGINFNRQVKLNKHMEIHGDVKTNTVVTEEKIVIKKKTTEKQTGNNIVRMEEGRLTKHVKIKTKYVNRKKQTKKMIKPEPKKTVALPKVSGTTLVDPSKTMVYTCCVCGINLNRWVKLKKHMEIHGDIETNTVVTEEKIVIKKKTTEKQTGNNIVRMEEGRLTKHVKIKTRRSANIQNALIAPY
ncbi:Zinc finger C2H2-type,Zinc finger, RING/FYVE/PHD-type [Cinara cedri]|uniref:Zinc finger C2H2-type,Zinc finger, RING/FYVE/PHD-type n=1 Tax=Cinara cedri TaxID=506608 RepID=A0A5E4NBX7_9HEMI|nr:Zinc finger C2H2-type,Zinc finger, RING/FYVE/PHD-type [Cinara cedri]